MKIQGIFGEKAQRKQRPDDKFRYFFVKLYQPVWERFLIKKERKNALSPIAAAPLRLRLNAGGRRAGGFPWERSAPRQAILGQRMSGRATVPPSRRPGEALPGAAPRTQTPERPGGIRSRAPACADRREIRKGPQNREGMDPGITETEKNLRPNGTEVFVRDREWNQITPFSLSAATCSLVMPRLVRIASLSSPSSGAHFWHSSGSPWILMGVPGMRISRFMPG